MSAMPQSFAAAMWRAAPVSLGVVAASVAVGFAPGLANEAFFSAAAQVIPVLLLGLAIEARAFGSGVRHFEGRDRWTRFARAIEHVRGVGELGMILLLFAGEFVALAGIRNAGSPNDPDPTLVYAALAGGFLTVAALAFVGGRVPRVAGTLKHRPRDEASFLLEVGMSNAYGDRDVRVVMNLLVPEGVKILPTDGRGNLITKRPLLASTPEDAWPPHPCAWTYASELLELPAGQHILRHFAVQTLNPIPIVLRLDSIDLPKGRVEVQRLLDPSGQTSPPESAPGSSTLG